MMTRAHASSRLFRFLVNTVLMQMTVYPCMYLRLSIGYGRTEGSTPVPIFLRPTFMLSGGNRAGRQLTSASGPTNSGLSASPISPLGGHTFEIQPGIGQLPTERDHY